MFQHNDITTIEQFTRDELETVIQRAAQFEHNGFTGNELQNAIIATLFFEPSTRTRLSFETAAQRLGARIIGFSGTENSSMKKGETFEDTIRMVDGYADCIVIRHPEEGSAQIAANVAAHPVINAGDGANQHPTQTVLDLYAMYKVHGKIDGITVALVGDLRNGRVPHSLAKALSVFNGVRQIWIAPDALRMPDDVREYVIARGGEVHEHDRIEDAIQDVDVLYMTRVQQERFANTADYEQLKDVYVLKPEMLAHTKSTMKIFHALPRIHEIPTEIDSLPQAYYFEQARGGVYVRAALLLLLLGKA